MGYKIRREDVPISCGIVMQLCDIEAYIRQLYPMAPEEVYGRIEEYASDLDQVNISVREESYFQDRRRGRQLLQGDHGSDCMREA